ncbi:MAG: DNA-binding response regulator, partial [Actinobacteria bacterium]|nr:DNA-binding response regulator [Actinomycetota bacterium]
MTIRVFLLSGHELVREGLRAVLGREDDIEVVGEADSAVDGLHRIEATRPDVVIADLLLSDSDRLDVCRRTTERAPGVACLILDTRGSDTMLLSAIRADAAGILLRHITSHELRRMIRFVATGSSSPNPIRSDRPTDHLNAGRLDAGDSWELPGLTPQE